MPLKKAALPRHDSPRFNTVVKQVIESIMGRRGGKTEKIPAIAATEVAAAPTEDEYNTLLGDVDLLRVRLNQLIDQVGD